MRSLLGKPYRQRFYEAQSPDSRRAADVIVPIVNAWLHATSVLDVGCGVGTWLASWYDNGVLDIQGVDGDYVDRSQLQVSPDVFIAADLTHKLDLGRRFDLVTSLEVAEHLDEIHAVRFVESLSRHADAVLFGAAIPGQGGTHHVNEKWPSYWAEHFARNAFESFDILRPVIWQDERIVCTYRQNTILYARGAQAEKLRSVGFTPVGEVLNLVHPTLWTVMRGRRAMKVAISMTNKAISLGLIPG